jgi:hypothetical protein
MKSWKTTVGGIVLAVSLISGELHKLFDDDPKTEPSVIVIIGALGGAGIGVFARDNNVSSKQAGVK